MGFKFSSTLFPRLSYKFRVISEKIINDSNQKRIRTKRQYDKSSTRKDSTLCRRTSREWRAGREPKVISASYPYVHTRTSGRCSPSHSNQNSFDSFVHVRREATASPSINRQCA